MGICVAIIGLNSDLSQVRKPSAVSMDNNVQNRMEESNFVSVLEQQMIPVEGINIIEPQHGSGQSVPGNFTDKAKHIDEMSRLLFPFTFTIFFIIYWTYYLILT